MKLWLIVLGALTVGFAAPVICTAEENPPLESGVLPFVAFDFASGAFNKYVWRGLQVTNGPVFQPEVTLGKGNLTFNCWANMDLDRVNDRQLEINEVDYTLEYGFRLSDLSLSVGAIRYTFPTTDLSSTTELTMSSGLDVVLRPTLRVFRDVEEANGTYAMFSLAHSLYIDYLKLPLNLTTSLGWGSRNHNLFYYGVGKSAFADLTLGLAVPFTFREKFTLTPSFGYSGLVSGSVRISQPASDFFLTGISFSSTF